MMSVMYVMSEMSVMSMMSLTWGQARKTSKRGPVVRDVISGRALSVMPAICKWGVCL